MALGIFQVFSVTPLGGSPAQYLLSIEEQFNIAVNDHIGARLSNDSSAIYRVSAVNNSLSITIIDDLTEHEGSEFGEPATGKTGFGSPEAGTNLTQLAYSSPGWDAAIRRNSYLISGLISGSSSALAAVLVVGNTTGGIGISVDSGDHLIFNDDNTTDIGASGATRPRTGYFGTSAVIDDVVINSSSIVAASAFMISVSGSNDLTFQARGSSITLNDIIDTDLVADTTFSSTSVIGSVNELRAEVVSLAGASSSLLGITNTVSGQFVVADGAGAISHYVGPTDQTLTITAGAGQVMMVGGVTFPGAVPTNGVKIGAGLTGTGIDTVAIGDGTTAGTGARNVVIGKGAYLGTGVGDDNVVIGRNAQANDQSDVVIVGVSSLASTGGVALGQNVLVSNNCVGIGIGNRAQGANSVSVGAGGSASGSNTTSLGANADATGGVAVALGNGAQATAIYTIAIGQSTAASHDGAICLGYNTASTAAGQLVIGSSTATAEITAAYIGEGVTAISPGNLSINGTGGSGADNVGSTVTIASGRGTGVSAVTSLIFQTPTVNAGSDSVLQTLATRMTISSAGVSSPGSGAGVTEAWGVGAIASGEDGLAVGANATATVGADATAIGNDATANSNQTTAVGKTAHANVARGTTVGAAASSGSNSTTVGWAAAGTGTNAVSIGASSIANGTGSTALGNAANAGHNQTLCLGQDATSAAANQIVVGSATTAYTTAYIGEGVTAVTPGNLAINGTGGSGLDNVGSTVTIASGRGTGVSAVSSLIFQTPTVNAGSDSVLQTLATRMTISSAGVSAPGVGANSQAWGLGATSAGGRTVALGENATAAGNDCIAIGYGTTTLAYTSVVAIGRSATISGSESVAIGRLAKAAGSSTAVGYSCDASGSQATALGNGAQATGSQSMALGIIAGPSGLNAVCVGFNSNATSDSVALGHGTTASHTSCVALGKSAVTTAIGQFIVGSQAHPITAAYIGEGVTAVTPGNLRISGTGGSGADNVGTTVTITSGQGTGASAVSSLIFQTPDVHASDSVAQTLVTRLSMSEAGVSAPGVGALSEAWGSGATAAGNDCTAIGNGATASFANDTAIGRGASATGSNGVAIGEQAAALGNSVAVGLGAQATGTGSNTAIGRSAFATGTGGTALGYVANVAGDFSTALGYNTDTAQNQSIAIGANATTTAANQLVIGAEPYPITEAYIGEGVTAVTPGNLRISGTGGSGADNVGATVTITSGQGTGASAVSSLIFQTPDAHGTDAIAQTLVTRMTMSEAGVIVGNITIDSDSITGSNNLTIDVPPTPDGDLIFGAKGATVTLNDVFDVDLIATTTFSSTSLIGALNELRAEIESILATL